MSLDYIFTQYPWLFVIIAIWDLAWKGLALWKSAKNDQKYWFMAILVVNSVGILPIIYIVCCHYHFLGCCGGEKKGKVARRK